MAKIFRILTCSVLISPLDQNLMRKIGVFYLRVKAMKPVLPIPGSQDDDVDSSYALTVGRRIRHFRSLSGLTLREVAEKTHTTPSHLSLIENGHREPRLALLNDLADVLEVSPATLLTAEPPPDRRAQLEIELQRAQRSPHYQSLGAPNVRPGKSTPIEVLESLVSLHREVKRQARESATTPQEARRANTALRMLMRERDNYLPEIEELGEQAVRAGGYTSGALTHSTVAQMVRHVGFEIVHTPDLPHSTRTVTDLANGRIYLPPASIPGGHGLRSLALQAIGHRILGHTEPTSYADFLRQRLERSEEHTSELQSRGHLVCRLLLEK